MVVVVSVAVVIVAEVSSRGKAGHAYHRGAGNMSAVPRRLLHFAFMTPGLWGESGCQQSATRACEPEPITPIWSQLWA